MPEYQWIEKMKNIAKRNILVLRVFGVGSIFINFQEDYAN